MVGRDSHFLFTFESTYALGLILLPSGYFPDSHLPLQHQRQRRHLLGYFEGIELMLDFATLLSITRPLNSEACFFPFLDFRINGVRR